VAGARVMVASREEAADGERLGALVANSGASVMQATPSTWRLLLASGWGGVAGLKVLCGGEALPRDLAERILSLDMDLWNLYGPTETTIWSAVERVASDEGPVPIGRPIANTQLYVLDDQQTLVPDGVVGELYIGGDGLARGYLNRPELTAERFMASPFVAGERLYRTGDLARYRLNGSLEVLGRTDHQVKVRGYRIELGEIEAGLLSHPDVVDAVAVVREDMPGDKRIVAYMIAADGAELERAALRGHLQESLPDYMLPTAFVTLEAFPLTPNNKVDRKALPAPERGLKSVAEYVAPEGHVETGLAEIWAETLSVERVGVLDDFFELGGHSLLAVRLVADIDRRLGQSMPLAAVFQGRTIRGMLAIVGDPGETDKLNLKALVPLRQAGSKLPFFAGGSHPGYREVAEHLDRHRPFYRMDIYSLQQSRVMQGLGPLRSIEEMASVFIDEIRAVQPTGPYHLGGGCEGGMVAFEVARQLQAAGEDVASLVIWVVQAPQVFARPSRLRAIKRVVLHVLGHMVGESGNRFRWHDLAPILRHEYLGYLIFGAMESYRPESPYRGDLVLARHDLPGYPEYDDESLGWQSLVAGNVSVHTLPGNHNDWLDKHANALGRLLNEALTTDETTWKAS
jgi:thioesterase domain-containing protein